MIAAVYARVSTADQDNSLQIAELSKFAEGRGWKVHVFEDRMTGAKNDRPGLNLLMDAARRRLFDVVLVWKLDRFGRSTVDLLNNIRELEGLGIRFLAITQGLDTDQSNPVSRFLVSILGAVAELEREMIAERVRAGQKRARARGVKFGAPLKIFDRHRAAEMREAGKSLRYIADILKVGVGTVHRLLAPVPKVPPENRPAESSKQTKKRGARRRPKG